MDTLALNVALGTGIVADRLEEAERWGGLKRHGERWIVPGKTYKKMWKLMNLMKTVAFLGKGSTFMTFLVVNSTSFHIYVCSRVIMVKNC